MLDRNIGYNRSKKETRKAHITMVISIICLFVLFRVVGAIQTGVVQLLTGGETTAPLGYWLIAMAAGMAFVGVVIYVIYKIGKAMGK